ncbi:hypothetical protein [Telmatospirillum siberiense]|uniref:O-antigen ligase domain-containing protein n=1 Tax=Telmatospirillum siberiense TaxID=382514 RepID=A0A2N3PVL4_9PROT|nr:hypothetical protein [Telmatospirillum siberiense]PKU24431.1 hypothetical protein CWS72_11315 [Telmatospirillum siberiense]
MAPENSLPGTGEPLRPAVMAVLLLILPFFGQSFHYMKDLLPFWALSKAFPILSLPLALVLFRYPRLPILRQILLTSVWLILVPSFSAIYYFSQDFFTGVTAQVKLLPLLNFFSFLGLLIYLRPSLRELTVAFVIWGVVTYVALILLWALVPQAWYSAVYAFGSSPLFSIDSRGNRIRMPMYFGMITLFYCYRRFLDDHRLRWLAGAFVGFALTLWVVKTRAMVVGIAGVVVINSFLAVGPLKRLVLMLAAPLALAGLFSFGYLSSMFSTDSSTGFDVRWETASKAVNFLGVDPVRWLFGVGTISPTSSDSLFSFFNHFFFLADITWLGILFEYGLIGAGLILLYEVRGVLFFHRLKQRVDSHFLGGLYDYVVYVILISNLYPPTLTPGETAIILSIFVYVWHRLETEEAMAETSSALDSMRAQEQE